MGLDPGIRTGVKVAIVDGTGKLLETTTVYPFPPKNDVRGTQAELFGDIAVLPAPTTPDAVTAALDRLKLGQLLKGYRGAPAVDTTALAAIVTSLSTMICASSPDLSVDLNPVRLVGPQAIVLDAKVSMGPA